MFERETEGEEERGERGGRGVLDNKLKVNNPPILKLKTQCTILS